MQAIVEGSMDGSVWPAPDEMGAAGRQGRGRYWPQCKPVEATDTINNGVRDMPWVKTPIYYVDQSIDRRFRLQARLLAVGRRGLQERTGQEASVQMTRIGEREVGQSAPRNRRQYLLEVRALTKSLPGGGGGRQCRSRHRPRRDRGPARPERRGQVDAYPGAVRPLPVRHLFRRSHRSTARRCSCHSVAEAEAAGVAFLAQEVNVAPDLTVAEGLFLNNEPQRFGLIDRPLRLARRQGSPAEFRGRCRSGRPAG